MNTGHDNTIDIFHFKLIRELSKNNIISQRELSKRLNISLGKVNYIINTLVEKGIVKAKSFKNSKNKFAYRYILTQKGIIHKIRLTRIFLKRKMKEYDNLQKEIRYLRCEMKSFGNVVV